MKISLVSGGFDQIHSGHIGFINAVIHIEDKLIHSILSNEYQT
jgi:phosphopantetheine adenylyltransferase